MEYFMLFGEKWKMNVKFLSFKSHRKFLCGVEDCNVVLINANDPNCWISFRRSHDNTRVQWYYDKFRHREKGPSYILIDKAVSIEIFSDKDPDLSEFRYSFTYFNNDQKHRLDGPAQVIYSHQTMDYHSYWMTRNRDITVEIFKWAEVMNIDLDNLSDDDKILVNLYWG